MRQSPVLRFELLPRFLEKEFNSEAGKLVEWRVSEIADIFHHVFGQKQTHGIEILIDALDECDDEEVRGVVRRFENSIHIARSSGAALKVRWRSRYYPHISLKSKHGVELQSTFGSTFNENF